MVRSIDEANITNWVDTGASTRIDRYQFDLEVKWTGSDGVKHQHNDTYTYPNDLADAPLGVKRVWAEEQIMAAVMVQLGIHSWEDYGGAA